MRPPAAGSSPATNSPTARLSLFDGKHHPVDSSEMAFKLAASQALKEAVARRRGRLLEPVMTIRC